MRGEALTTIALKGALRAVICTSTLLLCSAEVFAGRPLTVDDANTDDKGTGHVEMWVARESGRVTTYNISPAYGVFDGLEVAALFTRDRSTPATTSALQAKWRITAADDDGCNVAIVAVGARTRGVSGSARSLTGIATCNGKDWGSVHFNVGGFKPAAGRSIRVWGVAYEREFFGVTPNIEWTRGENEKSTVQFGLRDDFAKNVQLDGSIGRVDRATIFSVGLTLRF
jgi:hypothetical protein